MKFQGFETRIGKNFHVVHETDCFLNYIHKSRTMGVNTVGKVLYPLSPDERQECIIHYAKEWANARNLLLPKDCFTLLETSKSTFSAGNFIYDASEKEIVNGLRCLRSFGDYTNQRFAKISPRKFMKSNQYDLEYVKERLVYLLHGSDDFITRIHDVSKKKYPKKLNCLGVFSALELYGTVFPDMCPPITNVR